MSQYRFRLQTLLKLRESVRNERRAQLAQALRAEHALQEQSAAITDEIETLRSDVRKSQQDGLINVDALLDANRYEMLLESRRLVLTRQVETIAQEIARRRKLLVEADQQLQVLEKLKEKQQSRHARQNALREIKEMDEIAARRGIRSKS